jgi:hypothetical protein
VAVGAYGTNGNYAQDRGSPRMDNKGSYRAMKQIQIWSDFRLLGSTPESFTAPV